MKLQDEKSTKRRQEFDKTLRLLLRYLPLTFLLSAMFIYILFQYTFHPEDIQNNEFIEPHGKSLYAMLIGFMVMSWSCIIYYLKVMESLRIMDAG